MARVDLFYADDEAYAVELGDKVEFSDWLVVPITYCGEITAIYPRKARLRIRYLDECDHAKRTGEPKRKVAVVALGCVTLIARAM